MPGNRLQKQAARWSRPDPAFSAARTRRPPSDNRGYRPTGRYPYVLTFFPGGSENRWCGRVCLAHGAAEGRFAGFDQLSNRFKNFGTGGRPARSLVCPRTPPIAIYTTGERRGRLVADRRHVDDASGLRRLHPAGRAIMSAVQQVPALAEEAADGRSACLRQDLFTLWV
jgi:hypothetical protein